MLTIRREQLAVFERAAVRDFERRAVVSLTRAFPDECSKRGREQVLDSVRRGLGKCKAYGIDAEDDVMAFLEVTVLLGDEFDRDPAHAWAGELLVRSDVQVHARVHVLLQRARRAHPGMPP